MYKFFQWLKLFIWILKSDISLEEARKSIQRTLALKEENKLLRSMNRSSFPSQF
jgi:hypothetical protein